VELVTTVLFVVFITSLLDIGVASYAPRRLPTV